MRPEFGATYDREPNMLSTNIEKVVHGAENVARVVGTAQTLFQIGRARVAIAGRFAPLLL